MKRMLCLIILCLQVLFLQAQTPITITSSGYTLIGTDSVASIDRYSSTVNPGLPASNASWDLSNLTPDPGLGYQTRLATPAANNPFPQASYYYNGGLSLNPILFFAMDNYVLADTSGFYLLGGNVSRVNIQSLTPFTRNSGDSMYLPLQSDTFSTPIQQMKFPATMNDSWGTTGSNLKVHFFVTATYFGLTYAPGEWLIRNDYSYKVVGWGQMRVPLLQGGYSEFLPVLQVQESVTRRDSILINGAVPPSGFLTALSIPQDGLHQYYITRFLRPGQTTPLAEVFHLDSTFSTWSTMIMQQNGIVPNAVPAISITRAWKAYPNPLRGQQLHISLPGNTSFQGHYQLINMAGSRVATGSLSFAASSQSADIFFAAPVCPGFYALRLDLEDGARSIPLLVD